MSDDQTSRNYNQSYFEDDEDKVQITVDHKPPSQPHRPTSAFKFDLMPSTLAVCTVFPSNEGSEPAHQVSSLPSSHTSYSKPRLDLLARDC